MRGSSTIRNAALLRDRGLCCNCGQPADQTHHVVPLGSGGQDVLSNVVAICQSCHELVHGRSFGTNHRKLTLDGLARARAEGRHGGRRPSITGQKAALVRLLASEGQSLRTIAASVDASPSAVARFLQRPSPQPEPCGAAVTLESPQQMPAVVSPQQ